MFFFKLIWIKKKIVQDKADYKEDASPLKNHTIITSVGTPNIGIDHPPEFPKFVESAAAERTLNTVNDNLQQIHKQYQVELLRQLLKLKNVSNEWFDVIMPIVWKCVDLVKPDIKHDHDSMDIRTYIKIKKLPGNSKEECKIVNGLVFTKNVAHKQMKRDLTYPKILLFRSSIEYQRTEEKLSSLEPIYKAEAQYLKNYCSRLLLKQSPDILVVEKSVAR